MVVDERFGLRKIDDRLGDVIEVIGEDVQRDIGHDFGNRRIVKTSDASIRNVRVT